MKQIKEWFENLFKMLKDVSKAIMEIFEKYAVFVFSSIIFIGFWYIVTMVALELVNDHITPLQMFQFKPYQGYIYAFPDYKHTKNYRLKFKKTENGFYMFFPNGGSIHFEDCVEFNDKGAGFSCSESSDKAERDWAFRYYGEKL